MSTNGFGITYFKNNVPSGCTGVYWAINPVYWAINPVYWAIDPLQ